MGTQIREKSIIILLAAGFLLSGCSAPPAKTTPEDNVSGAKTADIENSASPTASPTSEIFPADTMTPLPDTQTPIPPTNTPLAQLDTPVPATSAPTQVTLVPRDQVIVTQEPSATPTTQPAANPDNSALLDSLQNQLVFGVGGGGGPLIAVECSLAPQKYSGPLPAVLLGKRHRTAERIGSLCLVGPDLQSNLQVTIRGRNGTVLGDANYEIGDTTEDTTVLVQTDPAGNMWNGILSRQAGSPVIIQLNIWLPPGVNDETWQVEAHSADWQMNGQVPVTWPEDKPALFFPSSTYDPFVPPSLEHTYLLLEGESELARLEPSQTTVLNGVNLPANQDLPLALYQRRQGFPWAGTSELTSADIIHTSDQGELQYQLSIGEWLPPGLYHLTVITDPSLDSTDAGPYVGIYADTCPGAPDSDLLKGDTIEINPDLAKPRDIRDKPGINGKTVSEFKPGETAKILRNFHCANQTVWWNVRTSSGVEGWIAEGQGDERYIGPAQ